MYHACVKMKQRMRPVYWLSALRMASRFSVAVTLQRPTNASIACIHVYARLHARCFPRLLLPLPAAAPDWQPPCTAAAALVALIDTCVAWYPWISPSLALCSDCMATLASLNGTPSSSCDMRDYWVPGSVRVHQPASCRPNVMAVWLAIGWKLGVP
jgi:hypothetical protein